MKPFNLIIFSLNLTACGDTVTPLASRIIPPTHVTLVIGFPAVVNTIASFAPLPIAAAFIASVDFLPAVLHAVASQTRLVEIVLWTYFMEIGL